MLRYKADRRTLVYMAITTGLLVWQWSLESISWPLWVACMFFGVSVSVISHNHNHQRMWKSSKLNALTDYWLTMFYGFPAFAWIPTHNQNHHKFNNREGDYTVTYRFTERNNLLTLLTYPTISGIYQQKPIRIFLGQSWHKNRKRFWHCIAQYAILVAFVGTALVLDWRKALLYIVAPQQFALFSVLIFNYMQHVHADEESPVNHSRNITGPLLNLFLFNNGYHTVHHDRPGLHWSKTPAAHAEIAHKIDPRLNEYSMWWMFFRMFVLGTFIPHFRSKSMRLERLEREGRSEMVGAPLADAA